MKSEIIKLKYKGNGANGGCSGFFEVILTVIGISALVFFFSMVDDMDDIKEHLLELILIFLMLGGIIRSSFRKKSKFSTFDAFVSDEGVKFGNGRTYGFNTIHLNIYSDEEKRFYRYHLWDEEGEFAVYSAFEDDLMKILKERQVTLSHYTELSASKDGEKLDINCAEDNNLVYDLINGSYTITRGQENYEATPTYFLLDPKYKFDKYLPGE